MFNLQCSMFNAEFSIVNLFQEVTAAVSSVIDSENMGISEGKNLYCII